MPHTPFLVPGYGAQGATGEACRPCFRAGGDGAIVNASRSVIYAFDNPKYAGHAGDGWQACVEAAARDFAADIRRCAEMPG
jgi:orotidine-5'-phosphate decarboxylase